MKPEECNTIEEVRSEIDLIDHQLIELFSKRSLYAEAIVKFKSNEKDVIAIDRKNFVIKQRGIWAAEQGLDAATFEKMYELLIDSMIEKELNLLKNKTNTTNK